MYLAKYVSKTGDISRRKAVMDVRRGFVRVNNEVILDPAWQIKTTDIVVYNSSVLKPFNDQEKKYILFNKPVHLVTSLKDEHNRETVISFLKKKGLADYVYPVGRLDYHTCGLLLLTNDGDWAFRMTHPSFEVLKVYKVVLTRDFSLVDLQRLRRGLVLEDGLIVPDAVYFFKDSIRCVIVKIHSGKNRIVRRMFNKLAYEIAILERIQFGRYLLNGLKEGSWVYVNP